MSNSTVDKIVVCFVGDSGDGIQLIGNQFSDVSVIKSGNDVYTFVEYPSEIRAPAGSISGISLFQVTISSNKIYSYDSLVDLLVVFNPAALKVSLEKLKTGGILLVDSDSFNDKNLKKAGYITNPISDEIFLKFKVINSPITSLTYNCVSDKLSVVSKAKRCKNFFALGIVCWIYDRDINGILTWLSKKFIDIDLFNANYSAFMAGYNYCFNLDILNIRRTVPAVDFYNPLDKFIKISGNRAFSIGAIASSFLFNLPLFSANYPITPASDVFHDLLNYSNSNIRIFQLEDEIAAINSVIGASYGGSLSFTCTSGPGLDLMQEGLGLAIMSELPLLLLDIQRCGPSTGIPTKSEQTDLLSAVFGRHGESSLIVLAPDSPSDCFWTIIEGFCLSIFSSSPVIILSDSNLANSSELWKIPSVDEIKNKILFDFDTFYNRTFVKWKKEEIKSIYNWNIPGISKISCIGGLERDFNTGNVSHDGSNHFFMIKRRSEKIANISRYLNDIEVIGNMQGKLLVITWGSVSGVVKSLYKEMKSMYEDKFSVVCLRYINPFPSNLLDIINSFNKFIVIEENLGQLSFLLKNVYNIKIINLNQVTGKPFDLSFIKEKILVYL